jgi:hypothetical protein
VLKTLRQCIPKSKIDNTKTYVKIPYSREKLEEILKNG